jgi:uncharacterized protein (TIGR04255 family)
VDVASKHLLKRNVEPEASAPLTEALLEVKWALEKPAPGVEIDPHYKILLGRLFERMQSRYPEHEPLPTSTIPDHIVAHAIQHRLRRAKGEWPLIQVGPGILTFNETEKYVWEDFKNNAQEVFATLFEAHPKPAALKLTKLSHCYIYAIEFDYARANILSFLAQQFKTGISFFPALFEDGVVSSTPVRVDCHAAFPSQNPKGDMVIRFATGYKNNIPVLIWQLILETLQEDLPELPQEFPTWLTAAHQRIEDWFFKSFAGDLERRFSSHE